MANKVQRFIYNLSSAAPLAFVFALVWYQQYKTVRIPIVFVGIGLVLIVLLYLSFAYGKLHIASIAIRTTNISPNDGWVVVYIIAYLVPFASIALEDFDLKVSAIIALGLILILPFVNSAIPNPLLFIRGYHFYSISAENGISNYILISKRSLRNSQHLKSVQRIFEYLLLDMERG
jgi:hypothetical protein